MFTQHRYKNLSYILQFPADYAPEQAYPLLIFMHGAGTRGEDMDKLKDNPFFRIINQYDNFPFIVAAPLCAADTWFDVLETVNAWAAEMAKHPMVDADRVYLIGASMGGYAVWQMAMSQPSLYAAAVPICGGGMAWNVPRMKPVPVWAFHGDSDPVVHPEQSQAMVNALTACGGEAKLTVYPDCGHDAWSATYGNIAVFEWLLSKVRQGSAETKPDFNDSKVYG